MLRRPYGVTQVACSLLLLLTVNSAGADSESANETGEDAKQPEPRVIKRYSYSNLGEPKYDNEFTHFDYVDPDAPKGGELHQAAIGTYDNFNRYSSRGNPAVMSDEFNDTLMTPSLDEIDVYYPLIAESLEYPEDHMWVIFHINPKARDQAGKAVTAEDVVFSFNKFMSQGVSQFRTFYSNVKDVEALDEHRVKFSFEEPGREDIGGLVSLTVLPKHYWEERDFSEPLEKPPIGSGAYKVKDYRMGQSVTYERLSDYWAADLPSRKGTLNFDTLRFDYYRDTTVALEAFKAGEYDFRTENVAKQWAEDYDFSAVKQGKVVLEELEHSEPQPMSAFVFNTQHELFQDRRVRQALNYALDFEWMNTNLFYDQYQRNHSFFQNTEYEAQGKPSELEVEILTPFKDELPKDVFGEVWRPNVTDGSGNIRPALRQAMELLKEAGWELKNRKLVHSETGRPFSFELIYYSSASERTAQPYKRNLERLGIDMQLRQLDSSQFLSRLRDGDYDMIDQGYSANPYPQSTMPIVWHSDYIDSSYNQARVKDPVVDALMKGVLANQQNPEKLKAYGHAFDRVALWNFYVVPKWHSSTYRVASWDQFSRPKTRPDYDLGLKTWWYDEDKAKNLRR